MRGRRTRVVALIAGLAAAAATVPAVADTTPTAASNEAAAQSDAAYLPAQLPVPPGATESSGEPVGDDGLLAHLGLDEVTPNLVDEHDWWVVAGAPVSVLSYIDSHAPSGSKL